jgi:glycosyltransferase involved in cell wall biosynthesis
MGFGVYFDPGKTTSGQRFFAELYRALAQETVPLDRRPAAILFNVSAPIGAIIAAKFRRQKVVLRVDGLYFDRLSEAFLATFRWPLRQVFLIGLKYAGAHDCLAHLANLVNQNYGAFFRILLADLVIYQSRYSRDVHRRYFPNKPYRIIVNGASYQAEETAVRVTERSDTIRLVTVYDDWKPAKRIHDLVEFVKWVHERKHIPVRLTMLGYTGRIPTCGPPDGKTLIEKASYIQTFPRFKSFSGDIRNALLDSDMYITFTYRDPCPNVVIEAMAHGLPVVGVASGGLPDIVGDAGVLLPERDDGELFFTASRYENDFQPIEYEQTLSAVFEVKANAQLFRSRVRERFSSDLDIHVVAERYASAIESLIEPQRDSLTEVKAES